MENISKIVPKEAIVISYSEDTIEIPGIVILKRKGSNNLVQKLLNPSIEIIDIENNVFSDMISTIIASEVESNRIINESRVKPIKKVIININSLMNLAVFVRLSEESILINDYIFTKSETEFHGDGMFTSRKVYFIKDEDLKKLKDIFI